MSRVRLWLSFTGVICLLAALGGALVWNRPAGPTQGAAPAAPGETRGPAPYAGSAACKPCHPAEHAAWETSHHALAERRLDRNRDRTAFEPERVVRPGSIEWTVRTGASGPELVTLGADGRPGVFRPERWIGVAPLEQPVLPFPGGRWQVASLAHDPVRGDWFDVFGTEDRKPHEWGYWANRGLNWSSMCAGCHVTDLKKGYDPATDTYATTWLELGVGCEACHGPSRRHAEEASRDRGRAPRAARRSPDLWLDTCGSCHARRVELTGKFRPGDLFVDHFRPALVDELPTYHPDGQVADENFEYTSFLLSRMHGEGVRCGNCHDPHSARLKLQGNALCLQCHQGKIDPAAHSHHDPAAAGGQCVNCHMPQTTYMARHPRRDHGLTIPDPLLTREWGIPNACNRCHQEKSTDWAVEAAGRMFGKKLDRPTRERARTIARARKGLGAAVPDLLQLVVSERSAAWRASATAILGVWSDHPLVRPALSALLLDREPLVRAAAARSLEHAGDERQDLRALLADATRLVRVEAAWVLRREPGILGRAGEDMEAQLAWSADQPQGLLQQGILKLDRGDPGGAAALIQRALEWDPRSAPFRQALAIALEASGDVKGSIAQLEEAVKLEPRDPEYPFALGLAHAAADDARSAVLALERTCELDPHHARAWYNLGLARARLGLDQPAHEALRRAQTEDPDAPEYPYARATLHLKKEEPSAAREAAREALAIDPDYGPARELLEALGDG